MTGYVVSGGPVRTRPDDAAGVGTALTRAARIAPQAGVGVLDATGRDFRTYPRLLERSRRLLSGLRSVGVHGGDTIVLQLSGIHDHLAAVWACLLGGVRPVVLTVPETPERAEPHLDRLRHAWRTLGEPPVLADTRAASLLADRLPDTARLVPFDRLGRDAAPAMDTTAPSTGPVMYLLSSGSTGKPKVIELTDRGLVELAVGAREQLDMDTGQTTFNWMPLDHSGAFLLYHVAQVFLAATNWHAPTEWVLGDPLRWLTGMADLGAEHGWAPNFAYRLVGRAVRERGAGPIDLSGVKTLVSGGEQVIESVMAEFLAATTELGITPAALRPCWGMTETTTAISCGRYDHPEPIVTVDGRRLVAVGAPSPGAEFRVVAPDGACLPEGRVGALQVRSARITSGYVGDSGPPVDSDGWFDTGDLAYLADGRLTVTGRRKDVIILNGDNHDCHRIEEVVGRVDGVRPGLVAAVGVPDAERGSEVLGLMVVASGAETDVATAIRRAVSERLGLTARRPGDRSRIGPSPHAERKAAPCGGSGGTGDWSVRRGHRARRDAALRPAASRRHPRRNPGHRPVPAAVRAPGGLARGAGLRSAAGPPPLRTGRRLAAASPAGRGTVPPREPTDHERDPAAAPPNGCPGVHPAW